MEPSSRSDGRRSPRLQRILNACRQKLERASVAASVPHAAWNSAVLGWLALQRRLAPSSTRSYPLYVDVLGRRAVVRVGAGSDETVFAEVFVDRQYANTGVDDPRVILDLGGNVGFSAVYFALHFPRARIFVLEPNPEAYARLLENIRPFSNIRAFPLALTADGAAALLYATPGSSMSSSLKERSQGSEAMRVPATTLDAFLTAEGLDKVDILKFDIEGAEHEVFRAAQCLPRVRAIIGEVHDDLMPVSGEVFRSLFNDFELTEVATTPVRRLLRGQRKSP